MPVKTPPKMFETRSQAWSEVGLLEQVSPRAARRAGWEAVLLGVLFVVVVAVYDNRTSLFGLEGRGSSPELNTAARILTVLVLVILGWAIARNFGRALGPALFRRLDPATAGPVGFLIRLATLAVALLVALSVAGVQARTLLVGGAFTAVILGLAAQQTLGNLFAGVVLLSARPFRVGDRVRLQGGPLAGQLEGTVSSQGLLYTTFVTGESAIMVPNSVVLNVAVSAQPPAREREREGG
jgi:small conductance mechanosensitive channel